MNQTISTVQRVAMPGSDIYLVTLADGSVMWVPQAPLNADYVRIQAWVAAGGTIAS